MRSTDCVIGSIVGRIYQFFVHGRYKTCYVVLRLKLHSDIPLLYHPEFKEYVPPRGDRGSCSVLS